MLFGRKIRELSLYSAVKYHFIFPGHSNFVIMSLETKELNLACLPILKQVSEMKLN